ncbi:hypothetical protein ACWC09_27305 [Streptomyces sp. NPDC001617]
MANSWAWAKEELLFADGWLTLAGPNGSGKSLSASVMHRRQVAQAEAAVAQAQEAADGAQSAVVAAWEQWQGLVRRVAA